MTDNPTTQPDMQSLPGGTREEVVDYPFPLQVKGGSIRDANDQYVAELSSIRGAPARDAMAKFLVDAANSAFSLPLPDRVCPICDSPAVQKNGYCNIHQDLSPDRVQATSEGIQSSTEQAEAPIGHRR